MKTNIKRLASMMLAMAMIASMFVVGGLSVSAGDITIPTNIDLTAPATGAKAQTEITGVAGCTITVSWDNALDSGNFKAETVYTATITVALTDSANDTWDGSVLANAITVNSSPSASSTAITGTDDDTDPITIVTTAFPKTAAAQGGTGTPTIEITKQPAGKSVTVGDIKTTDKLSITAKVTPTGTPLVYEWQYSSTGVKGSYTAIDDDGDSAELALTDDLIDSKGKHYFICIVSTDDGEVEVTSDAAEVTATEKLTGKISTANDEVTDDYVIDLILEKIVGNKMANYEIVSYSLDGGKKWKTVKKETFAENNGLAKLLNKGLTLTIADTAIVKKGTGKGLPEAGGTWVTFPAIQKRDKTPKLVANYMINYKTDSTDLNTWTLSEKGGAKEYTGIENIEISGVPSKVALDSVFEGKIEGKKGRYWIPLDDLSNTIKTFESKPFKTPYVIRVASRTDSAGSTPKYYPAAKEAKINVLSEVKAPKAKFKTIKATKEGDPDTYEVQYKDGMITSTGSAIDGTWEKAKSGKATAGTVYVRTAPNEKKPVSAAFELVIGG